ncbi:MAG TPA: hypothetical protein VHD38_01000 [Candidatus Paceibacterota bacterium]|nr:hypothetical protein [Candidatus Paceibacterota bacterium]
MNQFSKIRLAFVAAMAAFVLPLAASAHEVYVLTANEISYDLSEPPFDMVQVALQNLHQFVFWGFIAFLLVSTIFCVSLFRIFETKAYPIFRRMRAYAPALSRITVGLGFIAASYYGATYGPELPIAASYGSYAPLIALTLSIIGTLMVIGFWARAAALVALALYLFSVYLHGWYMLTYTNYLGEIIVLLILGSHRLSVHSITGWSERFHRSYHAFVRRLEDLAFPILRVSFGVSLIYASAYAKIIHNNLALQVASLPLAGHPYPLAHYFGFEPHFLVLGAAIIELIIGLFFILGIEIRWTSIFLLFWLSLSLWFFGESVWPHIILIGLPIAFIFHGYDRYSVEGRYFGKKRIEPIL